MNFSFASAPTTPFITQVDGRTAAVSAAGLGAQFLSPGNAIAPFSATVGGTSMSRATDPLHDIGSPAALQYLFALSNSPLFISESSMPMSSPAVSAIGMPKHTQPTPGPARYAHLQPPALIVTSSPTASGALATGPMRPMGSISSMGAMSSMGPISSMVERSPVQATGSMVVSPRMDGHARFFRPSEVFTTPEIRTLPDPIGDKTPELALFDDADALGTSMPLSALSPRTQTAQAGLTLLAASATYARDAGPLTPEMAMLRTTSDGISGLSPRPASQHSRNSVSPMLSDTQATSVMGAAFLNANGDDPTLMSQPHNSLAQHLSPPMVDRGARNITRPISASGPFTNGLSVLANTNPGLHTLTTAAATGLLTRNRSLLRQSSGLTNASFYNDLVPQPTESFFAPLDEVCSDGAEHTQPAQPRTTLGVAPVMGAQFSPIMSLAPNQRPQTAWPVSQRMGGSASPMVPSGQYAGLSPLSPLARTAAPHTAVPSPSSAHSHIPGAIFSQMPSLTTAPPQAAPNYPYDDDSDSESEEGQPKRQRTSKHKRDQQRRFDCDLCDRSFARQYNLKTHRLTHFPNMHESRPYKCHVCPKAFTRRHDLQRHAVLHERTGKHICEKCLQGFPRKDSLKNHQKMECAG
ncbi:hypothetical protein GGH97_000770 [Coemansia sp. RSA 475]|nr:hypothetical protein GGH97_000770 [Coemansia sp. RSA 475]